MPTPWPIRPVLRVFGPSAHPTGEPRWPTTPASAESRSCSTTSLLARTRRTTARAPQSGRRVGRVELKNAPPELNPDALPSQVRPGLVPGVDGVLGELHAFDRAALEQQVGGLTELNQGLKDPVAGATIGKKSGPGIDEMLGRRRKQGLTSESLRDQLPDNRTDDNAPPTGKDWSVYRRRVRTQGYVPPEDAQEKTDKLNEEYGQEGSVGEVQEYAEEFRKKEYVPPDDDDYDTVNGPVPSWVKVDSGGGEPLVNKGDWVTKPPKGDGGDDAPTVDPSKLPGAPGRPGSPDKDPDYVEPPVSTEAFKGRPGEENTRTSGTPKDFGGGLPPSPGPGGGGDTEGGGGTPKGDPEGHTAPSRWHRRRSRRRLPHLWPAGRVPAPAVNVGNDFSKTNPVTTNEQGPPPVPEEDGRELTRVQARPVARMPSPGGRELPSVTVPSAHASVNGQPDRGGRHGEEGQEGQGQQEGQQGAGLWRDEPEVIARLAVDGTGPEDRGRRRHAPPRPRPDPHGPEGIQDTTDPRSTPGPKGADKIELGIQDVVGQVGDKAIPTGPNKHGIGAPVSGEETVDGKKGADWLKEHDEKSLLKEFDLNPGTGRPSSGFQMGKGESKVTTTGGEDTTSSTKASFGGGKSEGGSSKSDSGMGNLDKLPAGVELDSDRAARRLVFGRRQGKHHVGRPKALIGVGGGDKKEFKAADKDSFVDKQNKQSGDTSAAHKAWLEKNNPDKKKYTDPDHIEAKVVKPENPQDVDPGTGISHTVNPLDDNPATIDTSQFDPKADPNAPLILTDGETVDTPVTADGHSRCPTPAGSRRSSTRSPTRRRRSPPGGTHTNNPPSGGGGETPTTAGAPSTPQAAVQTGDEDFAAPEAGAPGDAPTRRAAGPRRGRPAGLTQDPDWGRVGSAAPEETEHLRAARRCSCPDRRRRRRRPSGTRSPAAG